MNPRKQAILLAVVPGAAHAYNRLLRFTMRLEWRGRETVDALRDGGGQHILALWHSRFLMMPYGYLGDRLTVLASRHRDAELVSRLLSRYGFDLTRGSSTKGGAAGLLELVRKAREGWDLGFTPDGPRGPRRRVKPGVIAAARLTGLPIVPAAFSARPAWRLRSWDRTLVPRPFGRGIFVYGEPLRVPRKASEGEAAAWALRLEEALDRATDEADRATGLGVEGPKEPEVSP